MILLAAVAPAVSYSGAEKFERWAHFTYAGIPSGLDEMGVAAIADASCRLVTPNFDGFYFWRQQGKAQEVIDAMKATPFTSSDALGQSSKFTLTLEETLSHGPCIIDGNPPTIPSNFTLAEFAGSTQNWYHALCAPQSDDSWQVHGYDPAYQPQQQALVRGRAYHYYTRVVDKDPFRCCRVFSPPPCARLVTPPPLCRPPASYASQLVTSPQGHCQRRPWRLWRPTLRLRAMRSAALSRGWVAAPARANSRVRPPRPSSLSG